MINQTTNKKNIAKRKLLAPCLSTLTMLLISCHSGNTNIGGSHALKSANAGQDNSAYKGSQAYANSLFIGENVNEQTGTLTLGQNLINTKGLSEYVNLSLNLLYSSSATDQSILGLPRGWSYDISFVIPGKSLTIGGSTFAIDENWEDINGYRSGLKYVNNHGVKFERQVGTLSGKSDTRRYEYVYNDAQGGHQYFDTDGKLLANVDRFGNMISYYYSSSGSVYHSLLTSIVDSHGNRYIIQSGSSAVTISQDKRLVASFDFTDAGITSFVNAAGNKTIYSYDNGVITSIRHPSGVTSNINYTNISYKDCDGGQVKSLPAVSRIVHSGGGVSDSVSYDYGSGNNFTGYPSVCMGSDSDKLADSLSSGFNYDVVVTRGKDSQATKTKTRYNYLALPVSQEVLSGGKVLTSNTFKYDIPEKSYLRSASYTNPVEQIQSVGGSVLTKSENTYNEYGEVVRTKSYINNGGSLVPASEDTQEYDSEAFYLVVKSTHKDLLSGITDETSNSLNSEKTNIEHSSRKHNGMPFDTSDSEFTKDGLLTSATLTSPGMNDGITSVSTQYNYSFGTGVMSGTKINAKHQKVQQLSSTILPGSPVLEETTTGGHKVVSSYDDMGRVLTETDPKGNVTSYSYTTGASNTMTRRSPNGYSVTEYYDGLGRLIKSTDSLGRVLGTKSYNSLGQVETETDIRGNVTSYEYDGLNRVIKSVDALGNVTNISYSADGLTTTTSLNGKTTSVIQKNGAGAEIYRAEYGADGSVKTKTMTVDLAGNVLHEVVRNGSITISDTVNQYNGANKVITSTTTLSDGTAISRTNKYDIYGNITLTTTNISGKGSYSSDLQKYDELGRLVEQTNPAGKKKSFSYDADGNLISFTDFDGSVTTHSYDANGNELTMSKGGLTISKTYDSMNNVTSISDGMHTISYTYDQLGNLLSEKYPDGKTVNYVYDSYGTLIKKVNAYGIATNYSVDKIGRVTGISSGNASMSYAYTNEPIAGQFLLTSSSFSGDGSNLSHNYSYDGWGKVTSDKVNQNGQVIDTEYGYDHLDRLIRQKTSSSLANAELNTEKSYSYNGLNQLLSATTRENGKTITDSYSYDVKSNILSHARGTEVTNYTYNNMDQLTSVNGKKVTYDSAGNMTVDDEGNVYSYDGLNRLTSVTKAGVAISKYSYYPDSLLSRKEGSNEDQQFYYDRGNVDAMVTNGVVSNYMLDGNGKPLSRMKGTHISALLSAHGSTIGTFSKGQVSNSYSYDAYGQTVSQNNKEEKEYLGWNQEYLDDKTGLVFLRARFYNPRLMRFMNIDTYDVMNRYAYTEGDPINKVDPSGHLSVWGWIDISTTIIGTIATGGTYAIAAAGRIAATRALKMGVKAGLKAMIRPTSKGFWKQAEKAALKSQAIGGNVSKAAKAIKYSNRATVATDIIAGVSSAVSIVNGTLSDQLHLYQIADFAMIGLPIAKWSRRYFNYQEKQPMLRINKRFEEYQLQILEKNTARLNKELSGTSFVSEYRPELLLGDRSVSGSVHSSTSSEIFSNTFHAGKADPWY
ncbi:RHS repeat domain-containing protein [Aquella oligotrophica]|uniref:Teneurin-like YD-shell domain-containing protein n=1 Tax=Aquella oligotrophica TaxID=2067065 RepID=A0A2I7N8N4_9NEIS|nr:RHS repeat domain-containing protein [Aquella oligotrophica]AUR52806.1 hypothetical protein CUN60_11045 [Aquella oligotrophica]